MFLVEALYAPILFERLQHWVVLPAKETATHLLGYPHDFLLGEAGNGTVVGIDEAGGAKVLPQTHSFGRSELWGKGSGVYGS